MEKRIRIGIHLNNSMIQKVDCTRIFDGNPGIGGTQYSVIMLAECLKRFCPDYEVYLFSYNPINTRDNNNYIVTTPENLIEQVLEKKCDLLIIASLAFGKELSQSFVDSIDKAGIKTIVWGHNYYYKQFCDRIADSNMIRANVFVGKQQYDKYIDHRICNKSTYIYNMYPARSAAMQRMIKKHIVTYIGSLVPSKGFHVLAQQWPLIQSAVPDAELYVIGSGRLYNENAILGEYGIAENAYEKCFMKYLVDLKGEVLPNVHFMGVMGSEKDQIISKTAVGIVNPTGKTETFGISALDFESLGVPVVTIAKGGFLDTVSNGKTGYLYKRQNDLSKKVISLLLDEEINRHFGNEGIILSRKFLPETIIPFWDKLIKDVVSNRNLQYYAPDDFFFCDLKWLRIIFRRINKILRLRKGISVIGLETIAKQFIS